jgi:Condensation domain
MLPKFALAEEMQDLRRRFIAQASQTNPMAQRRNQAQRVSTRQTKRRSFPLSFAQQRLWVLDRLEPGNGVYHLALAVRLDGALDPDALQSALDEIAGCHEILQLLSHFPALAILANQVSRFCRKLTLSVFQKSGSRSACSFFATDEAL